MSSLRAAEALLDQAVAAGPAGTAVGRAQDLRRGVGPVVAGPAPAPPHGAGPLRSLLAGARLVQGATGGVAVHADGGCQEVPGLVAGPLLVPGSPVLAEARRRVGDRRIYSTFLWPLGGARAPDGHARVTVLSTPDDGGSAPAGLVLLSPAPQLRGLTPRELEVLGLLVEGCTNPDIARRLVVTPRTVATHLEHIHAKLGTPTRTHAAVRAEREGLDVPAVPC
ncbi:response regulator transcription factor [Cellulomonas hominis]|uniref:response regulator transcription factor n=1 Tax=Cellulomonas hominis TaxID=156981 RepID=UPI001FE308A6|nr:helix-turn-helix transcriptional regulator [Cellulomonas hominis]